MDRTRLKATDWSRVSGAEARDQLRSPDDGLTQHEATERLETFGPNRLEEQAGRSKLRIFVDQFKAFLIYVLIGAAVISGILGDWIEMVAILAIIVLSAVMGYVQEDRAEQAMEALKKMAVPTVHVRRGGASIDVSSEDLVPGDRVLLETGNVVPSDGRLLSASNLQVDEAALTGESEPVNKQADVVLAEEQALADRRNMVYSGTTVTRGRAEFVTTATGMDTELGRIAELIQGVEEGQTPLQARLDSLGKVLAGIAGLLVGVVFVIGLLQGEDLEDLFLTSVSLAVAAIPEAMPAVVTIALSLGAQRMLRRNALIRSLPAVETLGSVSIISTDKTGTLTENRMTAVVVDVANLRHDIDGGTVATGASASSVQLALLAGALCNDAELADGEQAAIGDPTETALVVAASKAGIVKGDLERSMPRIDEVPFDSTRKRMTTLHRSPTEPILEELSELQTAIGGAVPPFVALTKGAITGLLDRSSSVWVDGRVVDLDEDWRRRIEGAEASLASEGKRVLGTAVRPLTSGVIEGDIENDLIFVGMFGIIDPPREAVPAAIASTWSAGIRPTMITGDHPLTASHIAREIGIASDDTVVMGADLDAMDPETLEYVADNTRVFARVSPEHKLILIEAMQADGELVAMTGDGVNDAPALKRADIGIAMGITGTDVSKQASDMILLDDNYATIVAAVEEGRVIYDNIRKFLKYLLTCNVSEILVMIIGPILGMPLPLLPLQILWMNLVTDGLPALALGVEKGEDDVMSRPPRAPGESIFAGGTTRFIGIFGLVLSIVTLVGGYWLWDSGDETWQSVLFTVLIFGQLGLALEVRSERASLFTIGLFSNRAMLGAVAVGIVAHLGILYLPFAQRVFGTDALDPAHFGVALAGAVLVVAAVEVYKATLRATAAREAPTPRR